MQFLVEIYRVQVIEMFFNWLDHLSIAIWNMQNMYSISFINLIIIKRDDDIPLQVLSIAKSNQENLSGMAYIFNLHI